MILKRRHVSAAVLACAKDILWEGKCLCGRPCMKERRLTLDTNILFYAMDRDAGERHRLAMEIVDKLPNDLSGNPGRSRDCLESREFEMPVKRKDAIYLFTLHQNKSL